MKEIKVDASICLQLHCYKNTEIHKDNISINSNFYNKNNSIKLADLEIILGFLVSWDLANKFSEKVR